MKTNQQGHCEAQYSHPESKLGNPKLEGLLDKLQGTTIQYSMFEQLASFRLIGVRNFKAINLEYELS